MLGWLDDIVEPVMEDALVAEGVVQFQSRLHGGPPYWILGLDERIAQNLQFFLIFGIACTRGWMSMTFLSVNVWHV
jgi:hypothetical protein